MAAEPTTASRLPRALARRVGRDVPAALTRYRVMAWIVGVLLIALVLVAVPSSTSPASRSRSPSSAPCTAGCTSSSS
jgi:hypothetical protein